MNADAVSEDFESELKRVRGQLEEFRQSFDAIGSGSVGLSLNGQESEQKHSALRSGDSPYRAIVEGMGEGAATVSQGGVVLYANIRLSELIERDVSALVGSDFHTLVDANSRGHLEALLLAAEGGSARGELSLVRDDGTSFPVLASVVGLDIDGVMVRCIIMTDLTAQRDNANQLARAADEVAANARALERANRDLARSNEDLAQFAYVTSHDLSEPLRTIRGFADLLEGRYGGMLGSDADEFIAFIVSGCARMQKLIDGLLLYSRVGTRQSLLEPVDSSKLIGGILADLRSQIDQSGAVVSVGFLPVVLADEVQLTQVFMNLIRNALAFVAPGVPPRVCVSAERSGDSWEFAVADNGVGIPAEHRAQIFGMFKRLHTHEEFPGTGIGLAIVEKAVNRRGGAVLVEENPGGGARFRFTLPDAPPDELVEAGAAH